MKSIRKEKYHPGIQNGYDSGVHIEGDFGENDSKGKLIIICHHNTSTKDAGDDLKPEEIANEPSFTQPAMEFLDNKPEIATGGVYYYRANKVDRPHFYAGKARNLFERAGQKVRISDKDFVILVRRNGKKMDENWQTELEHLMDEDLKLRDSNGTVKRLNTVSVAESLCSDEEKEKIRLFFDSMVECLTRLGAWSSS